MNVNGDQRHYIYHMFMLLAHASIHFYMHTQIAFYQVSILY